MNRTRRHILKSAVLGSAAATAGCGPNMNAGSAGARRNRERLRILVLGGTGFIGPHMVQEALRRGHEVELFNRGRTNNDLFPDLKLYVGDRDNDLQSLQGGEWDVVIDNSGYVPRHVEDSARLLAPAAEHYIYISTISVYDDLSAKITEESAVGKLADESVEEVTGETYGPLKALCEQRVLAEFGESRSTILRPTYICGPGDRTDRYTYWPVRTLQGGDMLWPGTPEDDIQIVDVRDLAQFTASCAENDIIGTFNTCTPAGEFKMGDLLEDCLAVTAADMTPVWVSTSFLNEHDVAENGGLPIWEDPTGESANLLTVDASKAMDAGLEIRPTRETARDTIAWWQTQPAERTASLRAGLSPERETEILELWREQNA
jgi:2'-hydroxyisoflavone reductase